MKTKVIGNYQIAEKIGVGAVGTVFKGVSDTGEIVAIKQISLHNISTDKLGSIETEINLLKKLNHPNIVKYKEYIRQKSFLNIILEYIEGGSLQNLVKKSGPLPEKLVHVYIKQVLEGLEYLHKQGIVHRDIKGGNILFTKTAIVKLADFGFAVILTDNEKTNSVVGTPYWMSPEVIESKGNMSPACDIWSLGCTIIELLTGQPPYFNLELYGAMFRIVSDEHPPLPEGISESLYDFFKKCFVKDPEMRSTAKDLLKHPWIILPNKNFPVINRENKEYKETFPNILNPAFLTGKERTQSGNSSQNKSVDSGSNAIQGNVQINVDENHVLNEEEETLNNHNEIISNKRRVNSNTQNEVKNIADSNIEIHKKTIISPRQFDYDQTNIFDKLNKNEIGKVTNNYKNARNINQINNTKIIKNYDDSEKVYTHNNLKKDNKEFSPQPVNRHNKNNLTDYYNNNNSQIINPNKKLSKNSSEYSASKQHKKSLESIKPIQTIEKANFKPSISFQDENFCYKTRSTVSDEEKEIADHLNEINTYAGILRETRKNTIRLYFDDVNLKNSFQELLKKTNNSSMFLTDIKTHLEIKINLEYLNYPNKLNEKQLLVVLINLANLLLQHKRLTIESFNKFLGIPSYINILSNQNINKRIFFVYLFIINQLISDESSNEILEDFILFQLFIYVTKLLHVFPDSEIKAEIALIIVEIINKPKLLKSFISSGGYFILPCLLDPYLIKNSEYIVLIAINVFNEIFLLLKSKKNEIAGFFINNKLLSRINVLLFEIFSEENINDNLIPLLDRILDLILVITETDNLEKICSDNIILTLMNLCYSFPQILVIKIVKIFDNIMKDSTTKNKLENLGIMEFLVKLLEANMDLADSYKDHEVESQLFQKITKLILHQIKLMCKLNSARVEQVNLFNIKLAILDSIPLFLNLTSKNKFNEIIIPIFSEMISSTKIVRDILKDNLSLQILLNFIKNFQNYAPELISKIIFWLNCDKEYIENIILQDNFFDTLFKEIFNVFSDNFKTLVSTLLNFFETSSKIIKKFFVHKDFNDLLMKKIEKNFHENKEAALTTKILNIIDFFVTSKQNPEQLEQYHIVEILENLLHQAKNNNLVIIEEKVNNIFSKLNEIK